MKIKYLATLSTVVSAMLLPACGGGGGSSSSTNLAGSWLGSYHSAYYSADAQLTVGVDSSNAITSILHNTITLPYTGTVTHLQNLLYKFTLNDGEIGGLLTDAGGNHAGFLNLYNGDFGVVQKNASALATSYAISDLVGTWSGYSTVIDTSGNVSLYGTSSATVNADGSFSGVGLNGSNFSNSSGGNLTVSSSTYGIFTGTYYNSTYAVSGRVTIYLSPDKTFAASWACDGSSAVPPNVTYCSYNSWTKQ